MMFVDSISDAIAKQTSHILLAQHIDNITGSHHISNQAYTNLYILEKISSPFLTGKEGTQLLSSE